MLFILSKYVQIRFHYCMFKDLKSFNFKTKLGEFSFLPLWFHFYEKKSSNLVDFSSAEEISWFIKYWERIFQKTVLETSHKIKGDFYEGTTNNVIMNFEYVKFGIHKNDINNLT